MSTGLPRRILGPDSSLNMAEFRRRMETAPKRCCIEITWDAEGPALPEAFFQVLGEIEDSKLALVIRHYPRASKSTLPEKGLP
jgi:hypothetical protein